MTTLEIDRDVSVPMSDGVALSADIYRPADEPCPAVVLRTPYNKNELSLHASMLHPFDALDRGFAVVVQDCRGRFASEGTWEPFVDEADDGYDTVEWVADQPWCNGRVGITGASYLGVTTWQAVVADPPHLEAALPMITAGNLHDGWTYTGGAFELGFNLRWTTVSLAGRALRFLEAPETELDALRREYVDLFDSLEERMANLPHCDIPLLTEDLASFYDTWTDHPSYDDYWEQLDATEQVESISVPVLEVAGWYDKFSRGHHDMADAIHEWAPRSIRENHHVVIGPWEHISLFKHTPTVTGDRDFGFESAMPTVVDGLALPWFAHHLQDEDNEMADQSRVRYFTMGANEWRESDEWPVADDTVTFFLDSDGGANTRTGDGRLRRSQPSSGAAMDTYEYDPLDPVPSRGGNTLMQPVGYPGVTDQASVEMRDDVLVYTTPRLMEPLSVVGQPEVALFVASSAPDTDFTAKLVDVEPDGYCANVAEGIQRARYRNTPSDPEFMSPGETYELSVKLGPTAHRFQRGHRVRLEVSSSNFPRFDRNPNQAVPVSEAGRQVVQTAVNQVFHDGTRPSRLLLPTGE